MGSAETKPSKSLGKKDGKVYYGEVLASDPKTRSFRESPLAITQGLIFIFFFLTMIVFLIESQGVRFIDVYIFAVLYGAIGLLLVLFQQLILWGLFMRGNRIPAGSSSANINYMGWPHMMVLTNAMIVTIIGWALILWQLFDWLSRFHKTSTESNPDSTKHLEYLVYHGAMQVGFLVSIVVNVFMLLAISAHLRPLRVITHLIIPATEAPVKRR